jgi:DNA-binding NtrC family response regulator
VLEFEAKFIIEALGETSGAVTKAAKLLGLSHQNLSLLLKTRHKDLASAKKARKKRSDRKRKTRKAKK